LQTTIWNVGAGVVHCSGYAYYARKKSFSRNRRPLLPGITKSRASRIDGTEILPRDVVYYRGNTCPLEFRGWYMHRVTRLRRGGGGVNLCDQTVNIQMAVKTLNSHPLPTRDFIILFGAHCSSRDQNTATSTNRAFVTRIVIVLSTDISYCAILTPWIRTPVKMCISFGEKFTLPQCNPFHNIFHRSTQTN